MRKVRLLAVCTWHSGILKAQPLLAEVPRQNGAKDMAVGVRNGSHSISVKREKEKKEKKGGWMGRGD